MTNLESAAFRFFLSFFSSPSVSLFVLYPSSLINTWVWGCFNEDGVDRSLATAPLGTPRCKSTIVINSAVSSSKGPDVESQTLQLFYLTIPLQVLQKHLWCPFMQKNFKDLFTKTSSVERKVEIPSPHSPPHDSHFPYDVSSHSHSILAINPDMTTTSRQTDITKFNCAVSDPFPSLEQWLPTRSLTIRLTADESI